MSIDSKHPLYDARVPDWQQMNDCYKGERVVKDKGQEYLPPTGGMVLDGMNKNQPGLAAYDAYKARATFPDYVRQGIEAMVGIMHNEPARIEVPERMKPLIEAAGSNGESLQMFLRRMNEYQLLYGRCGILVEVPDGRGPDALPYLVLYPAPRIINWDDGPRIQGRQVLEFVTFDETDVERVGGFEWTSNNRWRICAMSGTVNSVAQQEQSQNTATGVYQVAKVESTTADLTGASWVTPSIGGRPFDEIPFVFVNTKDLASSPDDPPLLGLSNICLAIYRGEADLRQNLHMQGQDTLVVVGEDADDPNNKTTRLGVGAKINLQRDGYAEFIGVSADGLNAQKETIEADKRLAEELTSRLFDSTGTTYQSGDALRIRVSAKTATLRTIGMTGAVALKQALSIIARWIGEDPSKIIVEPNTDFADTNDASRTALELSQAKQIGFPLSNESMHRFAVQRGLTIKTFEQEMSAIEEEEPVIPMQGVGGAAGGVLGRATGGSRVPRGVEDPSATE